MPTFDQSWPSKLPAPTRDGYRLEPAPSVERTDMEYGPARQRRVYTANPTNISVLWVFSATEMAIFEAWFTYAISDGAAWFTISLINGLGVGAMTARFVGGEWKSEMLAGAKWKVSATLEVENRPIMTPEDLETALA